MFTARPAEPGGDARAVEAAFTDAGSAVTAVSGR
jgi:hypothetical protein